MNPREQRRWLAEQAARCMSEYAIDDPMAALRRVLARQGATPDRRHWPAPAEILAALHDYQRLFRGGEQPSQLGIRRDAALEAMRFFAAFGPRLVGAVLAGTADAHSPVQLHLHTDDPESMLAFLNDQGITHRVGESRIALDQRRLITVPRVEFSADGIDFQLWLLPSECERHAPLEADARTPMARIHRAGLLHLHTHS